MLNHLRPIIKSYLGVFANVATDIGSTPPLVHIDDDLEMYAVHVLMTVEISSLCGIMDSYKITSFFMLFR